MSRGIAVHVVAGILFVGLGTSDAQESVPRPAVVETRDTLTNTGVRFRLDYVAGIEGDVGVTVAIAPPPQTKPRPTRKRFASAMRRMLEVVVSVSKSVRAGNE